MRDFYTRFEAIYYMHNVIYADAPTENDENVVDETTIGAFLTKISLADQARSDINQQSGTHTTSRW